jgi:hypothetical protein
LGVWRLLGEQGAGLLHRAGRVEYGQAREAGAEAGTGVVRQLGEVDAVYQTALKQRLVGDESAGVGGPG